MFGASLPLALPQLGVRRASGSVFAKVAGPSESESRSEKAQAMRVTSTTTLTTASALLIIVLLWPTADVNGHQQTSGVLPGHLGEYVNQHVDLPPHSRQQLLQGRPVTKLLPGDASKEVAIFGAVWIDAPISAYVAAIKDIERFEKGPNFLVTKRISNPPRLEDFDQLTLPPDDVEDLKSCTVGDCELKLGEDALTRIRKEVDWTKPLPQVTGAVESLFRAMALEYVNRYEQAGNAALATYRDSARPTFVAQEFETMIDRMSLLTEYLPALRTYLRDYPKASIPGAQSFLYWQSAKFGLKPTIRINHVVIVEQPEAAAVATKMLYANHYFWTAIELRVLVPDPARGAGFWFASVSQSRSDGLGGFVGPIIRGKVRDEAQKGMEAALRAAKNLLERR